MIETKSVYFLVVAIGLGFVSLYICIVLARCCKVRLVVVVLSLGLLSVLNVSTVRFSQSSVVVI